MGDWMGRGSKDDKREPKVALPLRVALFVLLVCACLLGAQGWQIWRARGAHLAQAEIATANLVKAVGQHAADTFKGADNILVGIVERVEAEGVGGSRLPALMRKHAEELPQLHALFVYGPDGEWLANGWKTQPVGVKRNNADRDYFKRHKANPDRGPWIGPAVKSRSTGDWIVTVSRRLDKPDGSFGGVALAAIKMDYFKSFHQGFDVGKGGAILVASSKGVVLMRRPFDEKLLGKDLSGLTLFKELLPAGKAGTKTFVSGIDGVERITSYRELSNYPLVVTASISKSEALASWCKDALLGGGVASILAAMLAALGFGLTGQARRRASAESGLIKARQALEKLNGELETLAMRDALTGLGNRRHFDEALAGSFALASRERLGVALVLIDVDFFKQYNDTHGHAAGDDCLARIASEIGGAKRRPSDVCARYGGEEMAVLLPGTDCAGAAAVAEGIRRAVEALAIPHPKNPGGVVTISAGVASFDPVKAGRRPVELIEAADKALYEAKRRGRNQVVMAPEKACEPPEKPR